MIAPCSARSTRPHLAMLDPDDELNLDRVREISADMRHAPRRANVCAGAGKELGVEFIAILSGHSLPSAKD